MWGLQLQSPREWVYLMEFCTVMIPQETKRCGNTGSSYLYGLVHKNRLEWRSSFTFFWGGIYEKIDKACDVIISYNSCRYLFEWRNNSMMRYQVMLLWSLSWFMYRFSNIILIESMLNKLHTLILINIKNVSYSIQPDQSTWCLVVMWLKPYCICHITTFQNTNLITALNMLLDYNICNLIQYG